MLMSVEIEAKIKVEKHDTVRARLHELGAQRIGRVREMNRILDDAQRTLRRSGAGLRVREVEVLDGISRGSSLTYKGPVQAAELKIRPEIEIGVGDPGGTLAIFAALGYKPFIAFEKIRESWTLGDCEVELDELPLLGRFVEIEGPDEQAVTRARSDLKLGETTHISQSYVRMLLTLCESTGIKNKVIRFADQGTSL